MIHNDSDNSQSLSHEDTLELVIFNASGYVMGVEASQVRGLSVSSSEKLPVKVETLLGLEEQPHLSVGRRFMILKNPAGEDLVISAGMPVELHRLPVSSIHPLPQILSIRTALPGFCAIAMSGSSAIPLIDLRSIAGRL